MFVIVDVDDVLPPLPDAVLVAAWLSKIAVPGRSSGPSVSPAAIDGSTTASASITATSRLRVERRAGGAPERLLGRELASVAMHVLAEPVTQRRELTSLDLLLEVGDVVEHLLPDLHRHHRAEQIRREVADLSRRPVRVLQDALRVIRDVDAEVLVHLLVPDAG